MGKAFLVGGILCLFPFTLLASVPTVTNVHPEGSSVPEFVSGTSWMNEDQLKAHTKLHSTVREAVEEEYVDPASLLDNSWGKALPTAEQLRADVLASEYVKIEVSDKDKETAKIMEGESAKYLWWNRGVGRPVGVQSGGIPDSWLTANGCHGYYYGIWWLCYAYGPQWGRPYNTQYYGGWLGPYHPGNWDWFQIDIGRYASLAGFMTQGCAPGHFMRSYRVQYIDPSGNWKQYGDLPGNWDGNSERRHLFHPAIEARAVRWYALDTSGWACMRAELYTVVHEHPEYGQPLGISSGNIPDSAFTASSAHDNNWTTYGPQHSRLYGGGGWGGWIPQFNRAGEWIQVDLGKVEEIGRLALQGRRSGPYWVTQYTLLHSKDGKEWTTYVENGQRALAGMTGDPDVPIERNFEPPLQARYVRLQVEAFANGWPVVRWELFNPDPIQYRPGKPYGIESSAVVADNQLAASSAHGNNWAYYGPKWGRLYSNVNFGCWLPNNAQNGEWIQVNLGEVKQVGAVGTQGRAQGAYFATKYQVLYSSDGASWNYIMKNGAAQVFDGNFDPNSLVINVFEVPIEAQYVRLVVQGFAAWPCMRFEVYAPHFTWASVTKAENLGAPMGMESGAIQDSALSASSVVANHVGCTAQNGRLNDQKLNGAWCAAANNKDQWYQIETDGTWDIGGVAIQGRHGNFEQFVTSFKVAYSDDGRTWTTIKADEASKFDLTFPGCTDASTPRKVAFPKAIRAKFVRILPMGWKNHISMRVEIYDTAARQAELKAEAEKKRQAEAAAAEAAQKALEEKLRKEAEDREAKLAAEKAAREKAEREAAIAKRNAEIAKDNADKKKAEEDLAAANSKIKAMDAELAQIEEDKKTKEAEEQAKVDKLNEELKTLNARFAEEKFDDDSFAAENQRLLQTEKALSDIRTKFTKMKIEFADYKSLTVTREARLNRLKTQVRRFSGDVTQILSNNNLTDASNATVNVPKAEPKPNVTTPASALDGGATGDKVGSSDRNDPKFDIKKDKVGSVQGDVDPSKPKDIPKDGDAKNIPKPNTTVDPKDKAAGEQAKKENDAKEAEAKAKEAEEKRLQDALPTK